MVFDCRYGIHALGIGIVAMDLTLMKSNMEQMGKFSVSLVCSEIAEVCTQSITAQDIRLCLCV